MASAIDELEGDAVVFHRTYLREPWPKPVCFNAAILLRHAWRRRVGGQPLTQV